MNLRMNLPATATDAGAPGNSEPLSVEYFDNLGTSQSVNIEFTPTIPGAAGASNTWTMVMTDSASGGATIGEYTVVGTFGIGIQYSHATN